MKRGGFLPAPLPCSVVEEDWPLNAITLKDHQPARFEVFRTAGGAGRAACLQMQLSSAGFCLRVLAYRNGSSLLVSALRCH